LDLNKILPIKALIFLFVSIPVVASDYGTIGLIDTPTARMSSDGALTSTAAIQGRTNSYAFTYQATPWLEGTFRYTGFNNFVHYDRNYAVKLRLWPEQDYIPQVAVGIRDLVGTGIFGSEYVVASKAMGNFDLSLGMGWGRLAGSGVISNPMRLLSDRFAKREKDFSGDSTTGVLQSGLFFSGKEVGFFGGASYQMESLPVSVMLEYNPDSYPFEVPLSGLKPKSRWSMALNWEAMPGVELSLSRQHNEEWGISVVAVLNTKLAPPRRQKPLYRSSLDISGAELPSMLNKDSWYDRFLFDVERSGLILVEATVDSSTQIATIVMGNAVYPMWVDAIDEMTILADLHLPLQARLFRIVIEEEGHQVHSVYIDRPSKNTSTLNHVIRRQPFLAEVEKPAIPQHRTNFAQNKVFVDANLSTRFQFFDPDDPARYQLYAKLGISLPLPDNWALRGTYSIDIDNTFNEISRVSDSVLPHVRSDIARYLSEGETGIDSLLLEKRGSISSELHYRLYGGVLEEMYSGFGGELLYQPYKSRLAYGLSSNRVQQRDYDKSFKLLDYKTNTAFASVYWASPFYNFDLAMHAGRYLAGDDGFTLEMRRTFSNGWMIGLWTTLTDVSSKDFGEGSFDKGIFLRVPLDGLLGKNVRASYSTRVRPIQRDGGARLEGFSGNIWWNLRGVRYDSLHENFRRTLP
jgi:hypothetical protein